MSASFVLRATNVWPLRVKRFAGPEIIRNSI
jgi:hypothetical protein